MLITQPETAHEALWHPFRQPSESIAALSTENLEELGKALLDFDGLSYLGQWLEQFST